MSVTKATRGKSKIRASRYRITVSGSARPCEARVIKSLVAEVLAAEKVYPTQVSVVLVGDPFIQRLNRDFLRRDRATDVLAFPISPRPPHPSRDSSRREAHKAWQSGPREPEALVRAAQMLGEIYVSYDRVRAQAQEYGVTYREELLRLVLHGTLHLLGYNHAQMHRKQAVHLRQFARTASRAMTDGTS